MSKSIRKSFGAALLCAVIAIPLGVMPLGPATAQSQGDDGRAEAEDLAREGMMRIMRALELLMHSIPQYELPEVNENGDIIIRRKHRSDDGPREKPEAEPNATDT